MIHSRRRLLRDISGSLLSGSLLMTEARAATAPLRTRWKGAADSAFTTDRTVSTQLAYACALGLGDPDRVRIVNLSS
jgi:hypothetical protein